MRRNSNLGGVVVQFDRPDWCPLTSLLGEHLAESFMWMHEIRLDDGTHVHAYKHVDTRRYLHLSSNGASYCYLGDSGYAAIPTVHAVMRVAPPTDWALLGSEHLAALAAATAQRRR